MPIGTAYGPAKDINSCITIATDDHADRRRPTTVMRPSRLALRGLRRLTAPCRCFATDATDATAANSVHASTPPPPPQAIIDARHIRENAAVYAANCVRRNYGALAGYPERMVQLHEAWRASQAASRALREAANAAQKNMATSRDARDDDATRTRARDVKQQLARFKADEARLTAEMHALAAALPNLTSPSTPDTEQAVLSYINCDGETDGRPTSTTTSAPSAWRSHVHIGTALGLVDFAAASAATGWGWYYLLGDAARLEQALVQFALASARRAGWTLVSPPSLVRTGVAAACGFQPRDVGGEQQTYSVDGTGLSLTATAEIPLAALHANATLDAARLPLRHAAVSRCYRAEAGARGASTKGLYRVHEFTKVELFAWTPPDLDAATDVFDGLVDLQTDILSALGLPCRVLEMPATDLGASAYRKIDIEAFFPGRCRRSDSDSDTLVDFHAGWGEVSSASICTDYQARRLATRARFDRQPLAFPWTLNGTALAVPRVLAAILENGWNEETQSVTIPECLRPWMDGQDTISKA